MDNKAKLKLLKTQLEEDASSFQVYEILAKLADKTDGAARAAALLEAELAERAVARNDSEGEEAGPVPEEFNKDQFQKMFVRLAWFRAVRDIIMELGLEQHMETIMSAFIAEEFGLAQGQKDRPQKMMFFGSDKEYMKFRLGEKIRSDQG